MFITDALARSAPLELLSVDKLQRCVDESDPSHGGFTESQQRLGQRKGTKRPC